MKEIEPEWRRPVPTLIGGDCGGAADPPLTSPPSTTPTSQLDHFIAYALHRTRLHQSVTFAALYLLQCLKARFPAAKGSSRHHMHHLFISMFMLAPKVICDDTYSNKSWCIVGVVFGGWVPGGIHGMRYCLICYWDDGRCNWGWGQARLAMGALLLSGQCA